MVNVKCDACSKDFLKKPSEVSDFNYCCLKCLRNPIPRFLRHIQMVNSCWIWTAAKTQYGHGTLTVEKKHWLAHRYSWTIHKGVIPQGLFICHNCPGGDNPACVNPDHLFLGTHTDNLQDASRKGDMCHGEDNHFAKLTDLAVNEIRQRYEKGERQFQIAKDYGVTGNVVSRVINNKTWKHVQPDYTPPKRRPTFCKITTHEVAEIKSLYESGERQYKIAKKFSIDPSMVSLIVNGKSWV